MEYVEISCSAADDTSVSYCHYANYAVGQRLMPLDILKNATIWAMKENLTLQVVYPDYELPEEYKNVISEIDHADIVSAECVDSDLLRDADIVVYESLISADCSWFSRRQSHVFRTTFDSLCDSSETIYRILPQVDRMNVVITDVHTIPGWREEVYRDFLSRLSSEVAKEYKAGHEVQISLLTDRMLLDSMNNCNAGYESVALCPDGKFYVCPAFYADGADG